MGIIKFIFSTILYFLICAILCVFGIVALAVTIPFAIIIILVILPIYCALTFQSTEEMIKWLKNDILEDEDSSGDEEHRGATIEDCR